MIDSVRGSIASDGRRLRVYPADVHGRFVRARRVVYAALVAVYAALPWIPIGGYPAIFLDVDARQFHLFGITFNSQDTPLIAVLALGAGFTLLYVTAVAGRVWCGWACPQTVFLDFVYRPIERLFGGAREKRLRLDAGPWDWNRIWRKSATHVGYLIVSLVLAHVFLAYFVSIPALFRMMRSAPAAHPESFALVAVATGALYFNYAWFREQLCVVVCPYGRLQSALIDSDSLVIGYDTKRGEPRGKAKQAGAGDCVDCKRCVHVCPTGIDIRDGLQMDCIACTACVDACDDIMDKLHRPRGLIRYDSVAGLAGEKRRFLRPRLFLYTGALTIFLVLSAFVLRGRVDFEANLLRAVGSPYVLAEDQVRDIFDIHLVNKRPAPSTFHLVPEPIDGVTFRLPGDLMITSMADAHATVMVSMPRKVFHGEFPVRIRVSIPGDADAKIVTGRFLGPEARNP